MSFWDALGITTLTLLLLSGIIYWIWTASKRLNPNFKYWCKYTLFKRKYADETVKQCMRAIKEGLNDEDVMRLLLTTGIPVNKAKEKLYIFQEVKKGYKGGAENE